MNEAGGSTGHPTEDSHAPRKIFHLVAASIIPTIYYLQIFSWEVSLALVGSVTSLWAGADFYRRYHPAFNNFAIRVLGPVLKTRETREITSSSLMLIASTFVIAFMEREIACAALYFIALGDPAAAVVGKRFGKIRIHNGKSVEGTAVMFLVCMAAGLILTGSIPVAVAGALTAAMAELYAFGLDDNLAVPIFSSLAMTLASALGS